MMIVHKALIVLASVLAIGCRQADREPETANPQVAMEPLEWPFDQSEEVTAITTRQVIEDGKPILMAIHYSDDHSWAFLCNTTGATEDGRVICMGSAVGIDQSIMDIADLPPGWIAERDSVGGEWRRWESPDH